MFDFRQAKEAIIRDLKTTCLKCYLVLKEFNYLPKELNLIISYKKLFVSDELVKLDEDIENSYKENLYRLINESMSSNVDIFSEYHEHLKSLPNVRYWGRGPLIYNPKSNCTINRCVNILCSLDKNIFYKLVFSYCHKNFNILSYKDYEKHYNNNNIDYYIQQLNWKTDIKYIKLLKIVNLDEYLKFM